MSDLAAKLQALPSERRTYTLSMLPLHLSEAGQIDRLCQALTTFDFLRLKSVLLGIAPLVSDYDLLAGDAQMSLLRSALTMTAHTLEEDISQLGSQIWARLLGAPTDGSRLVELLDQIENDQAYAHLLATTNSLPRAGGVVQRTLAGHTAQVNSVDVEGDIALSGSDDKRVIIWNWQNGRILRALSGHTKPVNCVVLQGDFAFSGSSDKTVRVWNWQSGRLLRALNGPMRAVRALAVQDEYLLSSGDDKCITVWNWQNGELLRTLEGHSGSVRDLAVQGEIALSASSDKSIGVWKWTSGELLRTIKAHSSSLTGVVMQDDLAVSASTGAQVRKWNWQTGELLATFSGHTGSVRGLALDRDVVVSADLHRFANVLDVQSMQPLAGPFEFNEGILCNALQGEFVLSGAGDGTVKVWQWPVKNMPAAAKGHDNPVLAVALSGNRAWSGGDDGSLVLWNWISGDRLETMREPNPRGTVVDILIAGDHLIIGAWETIEIQELDSGKTIRVLTTEKTDWGEIERVIVHEDIAIVYVSDSLEVWDWKKGKLLNSSPWIEFGDRFNEWLDNLSPPGDRVSLLRFLAPHIKNAAIQDDIGVYAADDFSLHVTNWRTAEALGVFDWHRGKVNCIALQGDFGVSGADDQTIRLWNWKSGALLVTFSLDYPVKSCYLAENLAAIVAGDSRGNVHFFRPNRHLRSLLP
jgi:WD40 repeat protein